MGQIIKEKEMNSFLFDLLYFLRGKERRRHLFLFYRVPRNEEGKEKEGLKITQAWFLLGSDHVKGVS